ncbi:MAG: alpha-ketoglutarate-dependent dioxygenase AlkB [Bacteroidia bacterium]|nr:alpha-ketoglutarate-dependent dioxygenase AlkB [Bacteroidia bacterium]
MPETDFLKPDLRDAEILYYPNFLKSELAWDFFNQLLEEVPWIQDDIKIFGKVYAQPRLTAFYADNKNTYSYSGITMTPLQFTPALREIKDKIESESGDEFTSCLLNLYRSGKDSNGWHADDEKELGINPVIASVSLGANRLFKMKHRHNKDLKFDLILEHGSLLVMKGATQHFWLHQLPKTKKSIGERINLTFRYIK